MESGFDDTPVSSDRTMLTEFLSELQRLLGDTLDEHPDWFRTELHEPLRAAWRAVQPSFEMANRYITSPPDSRLFEAQLAHVGLTDDARDLKQKGFRFSLDAFRAAASKVGLKSVLGWANIILGSLAGIVPGGDAIKEYKEAVEQAVEDGETTPDDGADAQQSGTPPREPLRRTPRKFTL